MRLTGEPGSPDFIASYAEVRLRIADTSRIEGTVKARLTRFDARLSSRGWRIAPKSDYLKKGASWRRPLTFEVRRVSGW